ncbi:glycosyltransferase family 2 protein [Anthocerotibacter panamensis]|uniref:glycosyltransferase family 2 protein n=1 Tax=Anthocerotibacter panamensis TaxID=2857077 RepID=UPI001C4019F8
MARLAGGRTRRPPLAPVFLPDESTTVCVVVPTLNEEKRLRPCLEGLARQTLPLQEIIVVDSRSTDGTVALVKEQATSDPRFRVVTDDPLPAGWVGRPWALQYGFTQARSEWILGIDADTVPQPGLVPALVQAAIAGGYDALSLAPRFIVKTPGENWLHPALLMTLILRFGATGATQEPKPERVMANGQCFLVRRAVLERWGGYSSAKSSFCDDVTLVRHLARSGVKVGFLDGSRVIKVRMYTSFIETWREWGRSIDLKDASNPSQQWLDVVFLLLAQGLPLPLFVFLLSTDLTATGSPVLSVLLWLNGILVVLRLLLLLAVAPSFEGISLFFWLSPLADPLAALRILLSTLRRPRAWRGRTYGEDPATSAVP